MLLFRSPGETRVAPEELDRRANGAGLRAKAAASASPKRIVSSISPLTAAELSDEIRQGRHGQGTTGEHVQRAGTCGKPSARRQLACPPPTTLALGRGWRSGTCTRAACSSCWHRRQSHMPVQAAMPPSCGTGDHCMLRSGNSTKPIHARRAAPAAQARPRGKTCGCCQVCEGTAAREQRVVGPGRPGWLLETYTGHAAGGAGGVASPKRGELGDRAGRKGKPKPIKTRRTLPGISGCGSGLTYRGAASATAGALILWQACFKATNSGHPAVSWTVDP